MQQNVSKPRTGRQDRRIRNFLLQPVIQVRLGLYTTVLSLLFCGILAGVVYYTFDRTFELVLSLTNLREDMVEVLSQYLNESVIWTVALIFLYLTAHFFLTIVFTHRLIGPTVAFRRHIQMLARGQFQSRITLRRGDAFGEVAEDLNHLAYVLQQAQQAAHQQDEQQSSGLNHQAGQESD